MLNFLSLRLRLTLIDRMKKAELTNSKWVPELIRTLKKLKISLCVCVIPLSFFPHVLNCQRSTFKNSASPKPNAQPWAHFFARVHPTSAAICDKKCAWE